MSSCTTTVPYSVRNNAPVGHTSRHAASVQCLHTSLDISHRIGFDCSTNATWRHEFAPSVDVLSYDSPLHTRPSSGTRFHSLHATSHALQPMHTLVSVKKPTRGWICRPYVVWPSPWRIGRLLLVARIRGDQFEQLRAARPSTGPYVAGRRLDLLDVHVRVEGDRGEVVARIAGRQPSRAPVVRHPDLVQSAPLHHDRRHALRNHDTRLDRRARSDHGRPRAVLELSFLREFGRDLDEELRL